MHCISCGKLSFRIICKECKRLLKPNIEFNDEIVSFYKYENISFLLRYKYERFGSRVFWELGSVLKELSENYNQKAYLIPIDDRIKKGYSHTAILTKCMQSKNLKPLFSTLHSQNNIEYAGKSLEFRLNNPRDFKYFGPKNIEVILVDDIKTTGITLKQAKNTLKENGVNVLFSIVLAK